MKLEKSAQPVSEFELAAGEELQPVSAEVGDGGDGTAALAAVDVPVSIGMSSKLAVHTGPWGVKTSRYKWKPLQNLSKAPVWSRKPQQSSTQEARREDRLQPVSTSILSSVLGLAASNGSLFTSSSSESVLSSLSVLPELLREKQRRHRQPPQTFTRGRETHVLKRSLPKRTPRARRRAASSTSATLL